MNKYEHLEKGVKTAFPAKAGGNRVTFSAGGGGLHSKKST